MIQYRRGIEDGVWQSLWHFRETCSDYPSRNFMVAEEKVPDEAICPACQDLPH